MGLTHSLKNYANFQGRATRAEYWTFQLFLSALLIGSYVVAIMFGSLKVLLVLGGSVLVLFGIPSLAVTTRRLHDIGKGGTVLFVYPISLFLLRELQSLMRRASEVTVLIFFVIGGFGLYLFICLCEDSEDGWNRYGPNPKGIGNDTNSHATSGPASSDTHDRHL